MRWLAILLVTGCSFDGVSPGGVDASRADGNPGTDDADPTGADSGTPPNAFVRRVQITPPAGVGADVAQVAVPIQLIGDKHFTDNANLDGSDLLVLDGAGAQLPLDFEQLDPANGNLLAWVVVPSVPTGGAVLRLYYGTGQTAPANANNTWDGIADTVWHFSEVGNNPTITDATPSGHDGTLAMGQSVVTAPAVHGLGYDYTQVQILFEDNSVLNRTANDSFTTALWFNEQNSISSLDFVFYNGGPIDGIAGYEFSLGSGDWTAGIRDSGGDQVELDFGTQGALGADWHLLAFVVDRNVEIAYTYVDGVESDQADISDIGNLNNNARGRLGGGLNPPDGLFDEFRTYPTALSADALLLDHAIGRVQGTVAVSPAEPTVYPGTGQ